MIRKTLIAAATAGALLASGGAFAQGGTYVNAQLAIADAEDFDDEGLSLVLAGGFPLAPKGLSVEGEFTMSLSGPESTFRNPFTGDSTTFELDYYTLGGYGVYALPLGGSNAALRLRGGLVYSDLEVDGNSDSDIGLSLGGGITVGLSNTMSFIAEFTHIEAEADINHLSAGVQVGI